MGVRFAPSDINHPDQSGNRHSGSPIQTADEMGRTLLTGATGRLGRALRPRLEAAGHDVRATSREPPADADDEWLAVDLANGTGFEAAVVDVDVVVHAATATSFGDSAAVDVRGTEKLLAAAETAGVSNFLFVSIVGIEDVPFGYFEDKLAAEKLAIESDVPETILRATPFHCFVDGLLGIVARLPVWPLPTRARYQPVDVGEVAEVLVEHATPEASGRVRDVGGPEIRTVGELARAYRAARGYRRPIVRVPLPGSLFASLRAGNACCPDRAVGTVTWEEWLAREYG